LLVFKVISFSAEEVSREQPLTRVKMNSSKADRNFHITHALRPRPARGFPALSAG
jgi:hypothetical protein